MKRRHFIKKSVGIGTSTVLWAGLKPLVAHVQEGTSNQKSENFTYKVDEAISPDIFISDSEKKNHKLRELCGRGFPTVNVLYIFGGGALGREGKTGGIWCQDSFEDLYILRYLKAKYEIEPIQFIPVACPPIYSTQYYGYDESLLLNEADTSEKLLEATDKFIKTTMDAFEAGIIPVKPYFDLRYRLLFNREYEPGAGYGEVFPWQGKFRAENETQKYGVPTIWFLDAFGKILEGPFRGNIYHSDPYQINYSVKDIDEIILKYF